MSELNKHILLVMKWLDDNDSVGRGDLKSIRGSTYGSKFASYAHQSAYAGNRTSAEISVDNYFTSSGENKQDYIDAIEEEKVSSKKEPTQEWVDGLPPVGCECFVEYPYDDGCFKPFHGKKVTILGYCSDSDGESVFTAHESNGFIALYANGFRPLKTKKEKEREAFIERVSCALFDDSGSVLNPQDAKAVAVKLFDAGFKAPEGE